MTHYDARIIAIKIAITAWSAPTRAQQPDAEGANAVLPWAYVLNEPMSGDAPVDDPAEVVTVPVVASGGAGGPEHLRQALTSGRADAALAASLFHYGPDTISQAKGYLADHGIPVRPTGDPSPV